MRVVDGEVVRRFAYTMPKDQCGVQVEVEGEGLVVGDCLECLVFRDLRPVPLSAAGRPEGGRGDLIVEQAGR